MPEPRTLYLRVGVLVLAGLALGLGFVLFLTSGRLDRNEAVFETYFRESVQGLEVRAPVRYRGVAIGRVHEIKLVSAEYRRPEGSIYGTAFQLVLVRFSVDTSRVGEVPTMQEAIKLGFRVRIAAQGITGVNYLELDFVDPERFPPREVPWTPVYTYIPAIPSTVAQVQTAAERLVGQLQEVDLAELVKDVTGLVTDLRGELKDGDVATTLREATALLHSLRETTERAELPEAVASLRATSEEARALLANRELREALANIAALTAELRVTARRLPASLDALQGGLRTVRGTTTDLQADLAPILRDLRAAVANLRDTTETLRRYPSQALFGAPPPAPGNSR